MVKTLALYLLIRCAFKFSFSLHSYNYLVGMNIEKEMYAPENSLTPVPGATERYSRSILLQDLEEDKGLQHNC